MILSLSRVAPAAYERATSALLHAKLLYGSMVIRLITAFTP